MLPLGIAASETNARGQVLSGSKVRIPGAVEWRPHYPQKLPTLFQCNLLWVLRKIAAELAKIGETLIASGTPGAKETARAYFARNGQPYSAKSVRAMLAQRLPGSVDVSDAGHTRCHSLTLRCAPP